VTAPLVVVAEDDEDILLLVATRLGRDGFDVVEAREGHEALKLVRERQPVVAVIDIGMPGLDGLELTRQIRADESVRGTLVVLLTARAQEADVRLGFDAGADLYIRKPFSPAKLSTSVRELLKRQSSAGGGA
jgi:DNA-binding response OmpR family regulator